MSPRHELIERWRSVGVIVRRLRRDNRINVENVGRRRVVRDFAHRFNYMVTHDLDVGLGPLEPQSTSRSDCFSDALRNRIDAVIIILSLWRRLGRRGFFLEI